MNTVDSLTVRTHAALGRLVDLQRRAEKTPPAKSAVLTSALHELSEALTELKNATVQMRTLSEDLRTAREELQKARAEEEEFINLVPLACVWTDTEGAIETANEAAAGLLNVAARRLGGKGLSLFVTDRAEFFKAISALRDRRSEAVEVIVQVRPRERRTRAVRIMGRRVAAGTRLCWILQTVGE